MGQNGSFHISLECKRIIWTAFILYKMSQYTVRRFCHRICYSSLCLWWWVTFHWSISMLGNRFVCEWCSIAWPETESIWKVYLLIVLISSAVCISSSFSASPSHCSWNICLKVSSEARDKIDEGSHYALSLRPWTLLLLRASGVCLIPPMLPDLACTPRFTEAQMYTGKKCILPPQRQGPWDGCGEWQKNNEALSILQWSGVARQQWHDVVTFSILPCFTVEKIECGFGRRILWDRVNISDWMCECISESCYKNF